MTMTLTLMLFDVFVVYVVVCYTWQFYYLSRVYIPAEAAFGGLTLADSYLSNRGELRQKSVQYI